MGRLQKTIGHHSTNMDDRMSENIQFIRVKHKLHSLNYGELAIRSDSRREKYSRGKNPKSHLTGKLSVATTIPYCNDLSEIYRKKMKRRLQIYKVTRKEKNTS